MSRKNCVSGARSARRSAVVKSSMSCARASGSSAPARYVSSKTGTATPLVGLSMTRIITDYYVERHMAARDRMIESAAVLFRERGVHGTSFSDVLEHSGAPRGSIYHHFPGGKTELAAEAVRWAGDVIVAGTVAALADPDPL